MAKADISADHLRELLCYDPDTGLFTWKQRLSNSALVGAVAGYVNRDGYVYIGACGKKYLAHRLAWLYLYGEWPNFIDHINGERSDNRACNLRSVTNQINLQNVRKAFAGSSSGLLGAYFNRRGCYWFSCITVSGKTKHLGRHQSAEAAHQAYLTAKRRLHEGCTI